MADMIGCAVGWVRSDIAEQLVNVEFSILGSLCLLGANGAEGHKWLVVNRLSTRDPTMPCMRLTSLGPRGRLVSAFGVSCVLAA